MRDSPPRRHDPIAREVLDRLATMADEDRRDRFHRRPKWQPYEDRVLCTALCQGAALHYVAGRAGVKDFDVWTFFAQADVGPFPARWRLERLFDVQPFVGYYVDLIGRSLPVPVGSEPIAALRDYLTRRPTASARALAEKAVVMLDPEPLRGRVVWPIA